MKDRSCDRAASRGAKVGGGRLDPIALASSRQRRAARPEASVWVSASAGSGKTKVLTDRVLSLLLAGSRPERLLCLTFTKAAAAEMENRLVEILARWAVMTRDELEDRLFDLTGAAPSYELMERARRLFAQVLDTPGGMK
ncbi:MAG: UvrD-helicase domain-containing protein, partial [Kiloniellales bacterium]|nr:UvrD-helicase domain-containing protein [Kiloniellales bacterium]